MNQPNGTQPPSITREGGLSDEMAAKVMERVLPLLASLGAQYKIHLPGGQTYGDLVVEVEVQPTRKKRTYINPPGTLRNIYEPVLRDVTPGGAAKLTVPEPIKLNAMRSAMAAYASNRWGKEAHITHVIASQRVIELVRIK